MSAAVMTPAQAQHTKIALLTSEFRKMAQQHGFQSSFKTDPTDGGTYCEIGEFTLPIRGGWAFTPSDAKQVMLDVIDGHIEQLQKVRAKVEEFRATTL